MSFWVLWQLHWISIQITRLLRLRLHFQSVSELEPCLEMACILLEKTGPIWCVWMESHMSKKIREPCVGKCERSLDHTTACLYFPGCQYLCLLLSSPSVIIHRTFWDHWSQNLSHAAPQKRLKPSGRCLVCSSWGSDSQCVSETAASPWTCRYPQRCLNAICKFTVWWNTMSNKCCVLC